MQKIIFICLLLLLSNSYLQASESGDITYKIIGRHINHYKKFGFGVMGAGAAIPDMVNWIHISYEIDEKVDVSRARMMLLSMAKSMLDLANNIECYKKYMCKYPFTAENASLSINFPAKMHLYKIPPDLALAMTVNGNMVYFEYNYKTKKLVEIYRESYEDALKTQIL